MRSISAILSLCLLLLCSSFASAQHRGGFVHNNFQRGFNSIYGGYGSAAILYQQPYQLALPIVQTYQIPVQAVQQVYQAPIYQAAPVLTQQVYQQPAPVVYQQAITQPAYAPACATVAAALAPSYSPLASIAYASAGYGSGYGAAFINRVGFLRTHHHFRR